jgi:hypothetical protein
MQVRRAAGAFVLAVLTVSGTTIAAPKTPSAKAQCSAAFEEAQNLRTQKKLHAAREKYVLCARQECPAFLRKECTELISQTESQAPTVALEALDANGNADSNVKVTIDGAPLTEKLTGAAVNVEPGEHVFKFERSDGKTLEQRVLVIEGDKSKKVTADFGALVPGLREEKRRPGPAAPPQKTGIEAVPLPAWIAGGVAVVGFGSFTVFAISGKGKEGNLADTCSPNCTDDQVSSVKTSYAIADVSLVIGLVAAAAAVVLALPAFAPQMRGTADPWMPKIRAVRTP